GVVFPKGPTAGMIREVPVGQDQHEAPFPQQRSGSWKPKHAQKLPHELYQSLTWDRGKEMADHQRFTLAIDIKVYFCDPQSPWQRGSNENTNGLLRQYFPNGIDLLAYSQAQLNTGERQLNERPRKTLHSTTQ